MYALSISGLNFKKMLKIDINGPLNEVSCIYFSRSKRQEINDLNTTMDFTSDMREILLKL